MGGIASGYIILRVYGVFPHKELFEAVSSITAAVIITWVIYWMAREGPNIAWSISRRTALIGGGIGLLVFTLIVTYREVLETVVMLAPALVSDAGATTLGVLGGVGAASVIAILIYMAGYRMSLRKLFLYTSIMLVFVASGILGYGVHEAIEYMEESGYEGFLTEKAYELDLGEDSILHPEGVLGSILAVLIGYSASMEWARLVIQVVYVVVMLQVILRAYGVLRRR